MQGALLTEFLAEPLYLASLTVALAPGGGEASADSGEPAGGGDALEAAALLALSRAVSSRAAAGGPCLQAPCRFCPPTLHVVPAPAADVGLYPTATRQVPSGVVSLHSDLFNLSLVSCCIQSLNTEYAGCLV